MRYGYARVSSKSQDYAAQVAALQAAGCERIFCEKLSGKSRARPELEKLMRRLAPGDTVVVTKLDRIARSVRDLWNILHEIIEENGGQFISLREGWCDTTTPAGKLMVTVMGGVAEFERELIRERCEEGIERAKRKGTKFGRPSALDASQRRRIAERYTAGETMAELAQEYECGETTIWRALQ